MLTHFHFLMKNKLVGILLILLFGFFVSLENNLISFTKKPFTYAVLLHIINTL